jgi:hypothetical protein
MSVMNGIIQELKAMKLFVKLAAIRIEENAQLH